MSSTGRTAETVARDAVALVVSSYIGQFVVLVLAFALRRQLGPEGMGYVAIAQLAATYAPYVGLGAFQVAEREIAYENGRGDSGAADAIENDAAVAAVGLSAVVALVGAIVTTYQLSHGHSLGALLTIVVVGTLVIQQFAIRATIIMRTRFRFVALGWSMAATSITMTALTLCGAVVAGTGGALIGAVAGSVLQSATLSLVARPTRLRTARSRILARIFSLAPGFLMLGFTTALLGTVDQIALGALVGPTTLGLYSAAYLGNGFALRIPTMISAAIYPRMQQEYGRSSNPRSVHRLTERTSGVIAIAMPGAIAAFAFGVPLGIQLFLPEFVSAVHASRLLLVGILGLAVSLPAAHFLVTTNRQLWVVGLTATTVLVMVGSYLVLAVMGRLTIDSAAAVDAAGYLIFASVVHAVASLVAGRGVGRALVLVGAQVLLATVIVGTGMIVDSAPGASALDYLIRAAAGFGIAMAAWVVVSWAVLRMIPDARADLQLLLQAVGRRIGRSPSPPTS